MSISSSYNLVSQTLTSYNPPPTPQENIIFSAITETTQAFKGLESSMTATTLFMSYLNKSEMATLSNCFESQKKSTEVTPIAKPVNPETQARLERLKTDLDGIFSRKKDHQKIAAELFKILPDDLELEDFITLVFTACDPWIIPTVLDVILLAFPSHTLSPYHQICRAIVEDTRHELTNTHLMLMINAHQLSLNEAEMDLCYALAYRSKHPWIFPVAKTPVLANAYSLNFLWVNLNPQDRTQNVAQHIFGNGLGNLEHNASFVNHISRWVDANPATQINLWHDSALVTQQAQQRTFATMHQISQAKGGNLQLRDIRQLPNIPTEIEYSLHPGTPVYYRVDILKALITDYMLKTGQKYCVISDIDVEPMTSEQIFDQRTLDYLEHNGYVFNGVGVSGFENSFYIFNQAKKDVSDTHREIVIDGIADLITQSRALSHIKNLRDELLLSSQCVFSKYCTFKQNIEGWFNPNAPKKIVKCPKSQFNLGGSFGPSAHQSEQVRFMNHSNIPYTRLGRNVDAYDYAPIPQLESWKAEPLEIQAGIELDSRDRKVALV